MYCLQDTLAPLRGGYNEFTRIVAAKFVQPVVALVYLAIKTSITIAFFPGQLQQYVTWSDITLVGYGSL